VAFEVVKPLELLLKLEVLRIEVQSNFNGQRGLIDACSRDHPPVLLRDDVKAGFVKQRRAGIRFPSRSGRLGIERLFQPP
jgi:hypothetical protein